MNVLIVEDDDEGRRFLCGLIEHHWPDARVVQAVEGKTALKLFAQQPPDVTLLDIELPVLNGLEVLEIIRAFRRDAAVIMVSGHGSMENVKTATQFGIDGFLVKPFDERKVVDAVSRVTRKPGHAPASRVAVRGRNSSPGRD